MQYYDKNAVGLRIKDIRRSRGMTQNELAEKLDYTTERQLRRIENGETSCSVDKLMETAQILRVSTDYILFGLSKDKSGVYEKYFEGKSKYEIENLDKILEVAAVNIEILSQKA